jgi:CRP/FNR family cyclic AMP-dependent transcriptional regulator
MARRSVASSFRVVDDGVKAAIGLSHLRSLPADVIANLMVAATRRMITAGMTVHHEGDVPPHLTVVVSGLVRVHVTALDGRTLTVRYCRQGSLLGAVSLFAVPFALPASIQAVTDADLLNLQPSIVTASAERDVRVARALIDELSERVLSFIAEIPTSVFASVRQRVARHLLDLASEGQTGPELAATISQQDLAEAVGTVREVVVRALRELRTDGLVRTQRDRIVLLEPEQLVVEAYPVPVGGRHPADWNKRP